MSLVATKLCPYIYYIIEVFGRCVTFSVCSYVCISIYMAVCQNLVPL